MNSIVWGRWTASSGERGRHSSTSSFFTWQIYLVTKVMNYICGHGTSVKWSMCFAGASFGRRKRLKFTWSVWVCTGGSEHAECFGWSTCKCVFKWDKLELYVGVSWFYEFWEIIWKGICFSKPSRFIQWCARVGWNTALINPGFRPWQYCESMDDESLLENIHLWSFTSQN